MTIQETGIDLPLALKTGTFSCNQLQYATGIYYGFEILFSSAVQCKKKTKYEIKAVIYGPKSWKGSDGVSTVVCSGVMFTFTDSRKRTVEKELLLELDNFLK